MIEIMIEETFLKMYAFIYFLTFFLKFQNIAKGSHPFEYKNSNAEVIYKVLSY